MKRLGKWILANPSMCLVVITAVVCIYKMLDFHIYKTPSLALGWDGACYYSYLPATIVHKDLSFSYVAELKDSGSQKAVAYVVTEDGKLLPKTTCGVALMYLPFYLTGHGVNYLANGPDMDGYEPVYLFFICCGAIFYAILALVVLRRLLRIFFNDWVTALTLTGVFWGTNLYFYVVREPFMSHVYTFFLVSVLVYWSYKWRNSLKLYQTILLASVIAVIILIRPTNILFAAIPVLVNITSWQTAKARVLFLVKNYKNLIAGAFVFLCIISIQPLLWKLGTDSWIRSSYGNERFFWLKPHIVDGLFSYRKGWLVYSPVMVFAVAGFFFIPKKLKELSLGIWLVLAINIYIVFSWWCWWYGGSYGMRALIDAYPLWILCFAAFTDRIIHLKNKPVTIIFVATLVYSVSSNIHHTRQYRIAHIHHDSMTREAFWAGYWKETPPAGYEKLLRAPDYEAAKKGIDEYHSR